jgi:hypothetical protein
MGCISPSTGAAFYIPFPQLNTAAYHPIPKWKWQYHQPERRYHGFERNQTGLQRTWVRRRSGNGASGDFPEQPMRHGNRIIRRLLAVLPVTRYGTLSARLRAGKPEIINSRLWYVLPADLAGSPLDYPVFFTPGNARHSNNRLLQGTSLPRHEA